MADQPKIYVLELGATHDSYTYLCCPECSDITLQVFNNPIYIGFGNCDRVHYFHPGMGTYPYLDESYAISNAQAPYYLTRPCDEIRVRNFNFTFNATVVIVAR